MMLGLRTAIYPVGDLAEAKAWYGEVFDAKPYFDEPYYVGYTIGGFELGLIPDGTPGTAGAQAYWGVANLDATLSRLQGQQVPLLEAARDVGGGIRVAAVADPWGNALHLIENPHFDVRAVR
jgi:predicted enzyme related to lactoylglutathione lyase